LQGPLLLENLLAPLPVAIVTVVSPPTILLVSIPSLLVFITPLIISPDVATLQFLLLA